MGAPLRLPCTARSFYQDNGRTWSIKSSWGSSAERGHLSVPWKCTLLCAQGAWPRLLVGCAEDAPASLPGAGLDQPSLFDGSVGNAQRSQHRSLLRHSPAPTEAGGFSVSTVGHRQRCHFARGIFHS